jgi:hypothetical protein
MTRLTAPLVLAVFALAVPFLALIALAAGERDWDEPECEEPCSLA